MIALSDDTLLVLLAALGFVAVSVVWELVRAWRRRSSTAASAPPSTGGAPLDRCPNPECRTLNTTSARYCARCGADLHAPR